MEFKLALSGNKSFNKGKWMSGFKKNPPTSNFHCFQTGTWLLTSIFLLFLVIFISGCGSPKVTQTNTTINITIEGETQQTSLPAGSTVLAALDSLGISLGSLDRVEPPVYTILTEGTSIKVIRVQEEFQTNQEVIPFIRQELESESISQDETRIVQEGQNGLKEITYRLVIEDGVELMRRPVKDTIITPSIPEIILRGVQAPFAPLSITGKLAYLSTGNAWIMESSTAIRRPLVTTGDLDGIIFALSPKGDWLLFTRKSSKPEGQEINTLWVVSTEVDSPTPINLKVSNIIHFAAWVPGQSAMISYSTVEPRIGKPNFQANNDLYTLTFSSSGWTSKPKLIVDPNSGGIYGWWGTSFAWSPDGNELAYTRPDEIGTIDLEKGVLQPILKITPLQTHQDWSWIPGIAWGADDKTLFITTHAPSESLVSAEESPFFDLLALSMINATNVRLVPQAGMFAYPSSSSISGETSGNNYKIAFLQAVIPNQSESSHYRLIVMDRDGSNRQVSFPKEGLIGITPPQIPLQIPLQVPFQAPVWEPGSTTSANTMYIAILYERNIWLVDTNSEFKQAITGDGLIDRMDWK
jgi:hypothetical protein